MEPTVISVSQLFINRSELTQLSRPSFDTVRNAAAAIWSACQAMKLPVQTYTTAMIYSHKFLVLNPDMLTKLELPTTDRADLLVVAGGCIVTAFSTEGHAKKVDDVCRLLGVAAKSVLAMQRSVLETNCFDFRIQCVANCVIKLAKASPGTAGESGNAGDDLLDDNYNNRNNDDNDMNYRHDTKSNAKSKSREKPAQNKPLTKETIKLAWQMAIDVYETTAIIQFPAHNVAAACIEVAQRAKEKTLFSWDMQKFHLKTYAIRTSERLILEYYSRCSRQKSSTHAPVEVSTSPDLMGWLASLQKAARSVDSCPRPPVRDPEVSTKGTARYKIRGY